MLVENYHWRSGPWALACRRVLMWAYALGAEVFGEVDSFAFVVGWETARPAPFARAYRDPRFRAFTVCPGCAGSGEARTGTAVRPATPAPKCRGCGGHGRVKRRGIRSV
ncbi:hypothetical protein [Spongiactinospora sp. 9N601]|uniref:hypothetical protein n=1 Tax=Spongiactinospora sp. 9N601 TaxID=3375149 RepID=UPI00378B5C38